MPLLTDAALRVGTSAVDRVYAGSTLMWPSGAITHGSQITAGNTGYGAWFDSSLGRNLLLSDLTVQGGVHFISDFVSGGSSGSPTLVYGKHFTGTIGIDVDWITFRGCLFDNPPSELVGGTYHHGVTLDYCSVDPTDIGPYAMGDEGYSANRCYLRGNSDGIRINGGATIQNITECYIRLKMADGADHNDGAQCFGGSGGANIRRCNIDINPEGGQIAGVGGPDACVLFADFDSSTTWHGEVTDCLLDGAASVATLRPYDGALATTITYVLTGNRFVSRASAPVHRGTVNTTPTGQIVWSGNVWDDDGTTIPLV